MARYLVSMNYGGKDYSVTTTASDEQNAIEFSKDDCIRVAMKATGKNISRILEDIDDYSFTAVQI